jgi:hypothetical protein
MLWSDQISAGAISSPHFFNTLASHPANPGITQPLKGWIQTYSDWFATIQIQDKACVFLAQQIVFS